ncbi:MAG: hypothetical protein FWF78_05415 [Defluviitaleaceae bacterium]|nr:hypothetical protein [Defluviitaleaceae bacterium]
MELQLLSGGTKISALSPTQELESLANRYGDAVLKYCHSILLDYHEAQDVVQSIIKTTDCDINRPLLTFDFIDIDGKVLIKNMPRILRSYEGYINDLKVIAEMNVAFKYIYDSQ